MAKKEGKKIDIWKFYSPEQRKEVEVEVRMVTGDFGTTFFAECRDYNIHEKDKSIDKLKGIVKERIKEATSIKWKPYLLIKVSGRCLPRFESLEQLMTWQAVRETFAAELQIAVEQYLLGVNHHGKEIYKYRGAVYEGRPKVGTGRQQRFNGDPYATMDSLVPDTDINRETLTSLALEIERVNDRLRMLFAPNEVQKTLATYAGRLSLGPAPEESKTSLSDSST